MCVHIHTNFLLYKSLIEALSIETKKYIFIFLDVGSHIANESIGEQLDNGYFYKYVYKILETFTSCYI